MNTNQDFFACIPNAGTIPARLHVLAAHEFFTGCGTALEVVSTIEESKGMLNDVDLLLAALHHARVEEIDLSEIVELVTMLQIFDDDT